MYQYADYIAVNVSSPNTPGLRGLQDRGPLDELLGALTAEAGSLAWTHHRDDNPVPVLVKIAPDLTDEAIGELLEVVRRPGHRRASSPPTPRSTGTGVTGRDARWRPRPAGCPVGRWPSGRWRWSGSSTSHCDLPVIGVGGISSAQDGLRMLDAGASLLQLYTGFIYAGPPLLSELNKRIARRSRVLAE